MFDGINIAILIGAGLVAISALTSLVSQRVGAPLLLVFLGIGLLAGEDGLLGIDFDSGATAYFIGSLALAIILFDSGFETPLKSYRTAGAPALVLATLGVILTTGLVGVAAYLLLDLDWQEGMLIGAIVASTDAAAVFFLLRTGRITLRNRVRTTLEIESGANDPMAIFLVASLVSLIAASEGLPLETLGWEFLNQFAQQIGIGFLAGLIGGFAIAWMLNWMRSLEAGLYPILALAAALILFAGTGLIGGSGFLAAYLAGVVARARGVRYAARLRRFQVGMTWLAQIGMFLALGLLATPSQFAAVALPAIILALFLIFIARPVATYLCLKPFRFSNREIGFVGWVGLRGAVSILLAVMPTLGGVPNGDLYFNIVFIMVLSSLLIQGWTIPLMARKLKVLAPDEPGIVERVELELPGNAAMELISYRIHPDSTVARGDRVPRWARPVLILRDGQALTVHKAGPLKANDHVYLFAAPRLISLLDNIYAAPAGSDDTAILGDFTLSAEATLADVSEQYGATVPAANAQLSLADFMTQEFHGQPAQGDRARLGSVELVVRTIDDDGKITEIGLVLEPKQTPTLRSHVQLMRQRTQLRLSDFSRRRGLSRDTKPGTD